MGTRGVRTPGVIVLVFALLAGCNTGDEVPDEALTRARQASQAMAEDLMGKLFAGLDVGGPAQAAEVCEKRKEPGEEAS